MKNLIQKFNSVFFIILMAAIIATFLGVNVYAVGAVLAVGSIILTKGFNTTGVFGDFITIKETDTEEVKKGKADLNTAFQSLDKKAKEALDEYKGLFEKETKGLRDKSEELEKSLKGLSEQADKDKKGADDRIKELSDSLTELARTKAKADENRRKGLRDQIIDELEGKQEKFNEYVSNKSAGMSFQMKAVSTMGVIANSVPADYQPTVTIPHEMRHARNYIPVSPTNRELIRYLQFSAKEGAVGVVAAGGQKPKKDYNQTVVDSPVIKIAGLVDVTDEFLDDVDGSRAWLADELTKSLYDVEDYQVFKGPGGANNMTGLFQGASALGLPYGTVTAGSNNLDKFAAAITYVMRRLRNANAAFTSPEDILAMWINQTKTGTTGIYTYPLQMDSQNGLITIMGVQVIPHTVFNPGEGFVGDFAQGARLFQRQGLTLAFSTENNNNFETNTTTARVEERIGLANFFPETFVKVQLNGALS
jgi:HK97 family phage major capsid protein